LKNPRKNVSVAEYIYVFGLRYPISEMKAIITAHLPGDNDKIWLGNKEAGSISTAKEG